jgi:hypothetical protein
MTDREPHSLLEDPCGPEDLKSLSPEALPQALDRADLYRLLHEPRESESVSEMVLEDEEVPLLQATGPRRA